MTDNVDRPDPLPGWWTRNQRLRKDRGLPPYQPPCFADGTHTHEIVPELEEEFNCSILFAGTNTSYPDDWMVEVDGRPLFRIGRHRDDSGNTVYELSAEEFETSFRSAVCDDA
ncbi:hypothetical protein ACFQPA_19655 [Halomarina halobia]|uniref:Uncharacterized protein n=1 Tax=Halomarina halobia TaxID=3033386 RepID=A0ABD6AG43_9EURY|nr:hypothetical protein [Halomarina sp. PSR21]